MLLRRLLRHRIRVRPLEGQLLALLADCLLEPNKVLQARLLLLLRGVRRGGGLLARAAACLRVLSEPLAAWLLDSVLSRLLLLRP